MEVLWLAAAGLVPLVMATNSAQALYLLGWALRDTGEIEEAVAVLEMSVELEPTDFAHQILAELYQTLGQEEQAALNRAKIDELLAAR